jgi:hypothetical protein
MMSQTQSKRLPRGVRRTEKLCNGDLTRYWLDNGWFIDGTDRRGHQYHGYRYSIWGPGMAPSGIAAFMGGFSRLKDAIDKALEMSP